MNINKKILRVHEFLSKFGEKRVFTGKWYYFNKSHKLKLLDDMSGKVFHRGYLPDKQFFIDGGKDFLIYCEEGAFKNQFGLCFTLLEKNFKPSSISVFTCFVGYGQKEAFYFTRYDRVRRIKFDADGMDQMTRELYLKVFSFLYYRKNGFFKMRIKKVPQRDQKRVPKGTPLIENYFDVLVLSSKGSLTK